MNDYDDDTAARHLDLIRHACFRMAEFIATTTPTGITTTAARAEAAVKQALAEGIDVITLSAALDVSPRLIHQIDGGALFLVRSTRATRAERQHPPAHEASSPAREHPDHHPQITPWHTSDIDSPAHEQSHCCTPPPTTAGMKNFLPRPRRRVTDGVSEELARQGHTKARMRRGSTRARDVSLLHPAPTESSTQS